MGKSFVSRRAAEFLTEGGIELRETPEAAGKCNVGDGAQSLQEQLMRMSEAGVVDEGHECFADETIPEVFETGAGDFSMLV